LPVAAAATGCLLRGLGRRKEEPSLGLRDGSATGESQDDYNYLIKLLLITFTPPPHLTLCLDQLVLVRYVYEIKVEF
jgi:hypothetical protein